MDTNYCWVVVGRNHWFHRCLKTCKGVVCGSFAVSRLSTKLQPVLQPSWEGSRHAVSG